MCIYMYVCVYICIYVCVSNVPLLSGDKYGKKRCPENNT